VSVLSAEIVRRDCAGPNGIFRAATFRDATGPLPITGDSEATRLTWPENPAVPDTVMREEEKEPTTVSTEVGLALIMKSGLVGVETVTETVTT